MTEDPRISKGRRGEDRLILNERLQVALDTQQKAPLYRDKLAEDKERMKRMNGHRYDFPKRRTPKVFRNFLLFVHGVHIELIARRIRKRERKLKRIGQQMANDYNHRLRLIAAVVGLEFEDAPND